MGKSPWNKLVLFFQGRLRSASSYDLAEGVDELIKKETGGLGINDLRAHAPTIPGEQIEAEPTVSFVERFAKDRELSEMQKGSLRLADEARDAYASHQKRGRR